jgi:hypothetical protein
LNPLALVERFALEGKLPKGIANKVRTRAKYLIGAVRRVERASQLKYPSYYIEPTLPLAESSVEFGSTGVLYSRVIPASTEAGLSIIVQFTAPLIAFGAKGTIEAVAAHEFSHYVDLVRKLSRMTMISDERATSLFESAYADAGRLLDPKLIFNDSALVRLIKRKFKDVLVDEALNKQVVKNWIEKGLPTRKVPPEDNVVRLNADAILSAKFDPEVMQKVKSIETRGKA